MPLYNDGGHLWLTDGSHVIWTTDGKAVQLIPSAQIYAGGLTITFPDFEKGFGYFFNYNPSPPIPPAVAFCTSLATRAGGDWGPGLTNNLAATLLGTVPSGTDYLDVRVNLTRSVAPSTRYSNVPQMQIASGQWVPLVGGSCPLEGGDAGYHRGIDIRMSGTSVYLDRRQTIDNSVKSYWSANQSTALSNRPSLIYSGSAGNRGVLMEIIQSKPFNDGGNVNKNQGGSNECSLTDPYDYGATYSGDIVITPGRYQD